jgi:ComF family protein
METRELYHRFSAAACGLCRHAAHLFWPSQCLVCRSTIHPDDAGLCSVCWQHLAKAVASDYCRRCGREVSPFGIVDGRCGGCRDEICHYDGIARVGVYESTLRSLILAFKFSEQTELASRLSAMLRQTLSATLFYRYIEIVVPVPLHWRRRLRRGYNQSYLLARQVGPADTHITTDLVRIRHTQQQWDLSPAQRRRNVKGAFAVRKGHPFTDKTVLLVDDISTSGATLNECAKTLKQAGAKAVYTAVLATAFHDD